MVKRWLRRIFLLAIVGILGVFAVAITMGTGVPLIDNTATDIFESAENATREESLNRTEIEYQVHQHINEERTDRGRSPLSYNTDLREIARYHSEDMANKSYFAHDSPSGETMQDRYEKFGFDCRVQVSSTLYMSGAENIAATYAGSDVQTESGVTNHNRNETKIAQGLVQQWMNSPGHRENILKPEWQSEGIGIAITETDDGARVLATQNFC